MHASLPMYDLPEVRAATDAWWAGLARAFARAGVRDPPERLRRETPVLEQWHSPDLLLSQTCGYPLVHALRGVVCPVATPAYAATGCEGARYASAIVVREDSPARALEDLRGAACAINARDSQSGCNALRAVVAPLAAGEGFFARVGETGGHAASLAAVARGDADVCAVDCVTLALLERYRPAAIEGLRVLMHTPRTPGLPYVTAARRAGNEVARMREALAAALADPALASAREALLLAGAEPLEVDDYEPLLAMERAAMEVGYPELA